MMYSTKRRAPKVIKPGPQPIKPTLVKCGRAYVDPNDVSALIRVRVDLWIVKLKSEPNPQYPIWLHENGFEKFAQYFDLLNVEPPDHDEMGID